MAELSKDKFKIVGINKDETDLIVRPNLTYWQDAWRRLRKNKVAMISLIALIVLVFLYYLDLLYQVRTTRNKIFHWPTKSLVVNIGLVLIT